MSPLWWRSKFLRQKTIAPQPTPRQPTPPPPYDTIHPIPSPVSTDIPITSAQYDLEVVLIITGVCSNIAAGARIQRYARSHSLSCDSKALIVDKVAVAFATAVKRNSGSRDATALASASISCAIFVYSQQSSLVAATVAMEATSAIDDQVAAAVRKRGYGRMDSWDYIIRTAKATACSISNAVDPGASARVVAGAFDGFR